MDALVLLQEKVTLLIERIQVLTVENGQLNLKAAQLEKKVVELQDTLPKKEMMHSLRAENTHAHSIIDGLVKRIDSLLESSH